MYSVFYVKCNESCSSVTLNCFFYLHYKDIIFKCRAVRKEISKAILVGKKKRSKHLSGMSSSRSHDGRFYLKNVFFAATAHCTIVTTATITTS